MYFDSRIRGKRSLPWFDARTGPQKASDEYFTKLDNLSQRLDDVEAYIDFSTSLEPEDFDSGYEYVYGRIRELKEYLNEIKDSQDFKDAEDAEDSEELDPADLEETEESLHDIYEYLLDLYDDAILYDDYCGDEPDEPDDDDDNEDDDIDNEDSDEDDDWDDDDDTIQWIRS